MRPLSAARVLDLADRLVGGASPDDALAMLEAAYPETPREELAAWPLGLRDERLLEIRRRTLPAPLEIGAKCPECGAEVEVGLDAGDIHPPVGADPDEPRNPGGPTGPPLHVVQSLTSGDLTLRFRPVATEDLLIVRHEPTAERATEVLLERIVEEARRGGEDIPTADLTEDEVQALSERLTEADPGAEIRFSLTCPDCEHAWWELFDPASFLAEEIRRLAGRILAEIHVLASAYGWHEADLLAMSGRRRRAYLEMLGA